MGIDGFRSGWDSGTRRLTIEKVVMDLSLEQLVLGVLGGSMGLVVLLAVVSRYLHLRAETNLVRQRVVCRLCGHAEVREESGALPRCGICGALNVRRGNGKLG